MAGSLLSSKHKIAELRSASQTLRDYEHWLQINYKTTASYLPHARSFLKRFRSGGSLVTQLETYRKSKGPTERSLLKRFGNFLEEKKIDSLQNDLNEERLPKSSFLVKLFLLSVKDRLRSSASLATYTNVVNGYLNYVEEAKHIEKFTATRYIFSPKRSDFTSKLYAAVLKSFAQWALSYREASEDELSPIESQIRNAFMDTSVFGLRQIISIKAKIRSTKPYYKESLSEREREKMLRGCDKPRDRALLALMGWNGLRPMEVLRLQVKDISIKDRKITIWGKGRSKRHKEIISLFKVPRHELTRYLKSSPRKGKLFGNLNYKDLHDIVMHYLDKTGVTKKRGPFSPHSLRHTAGQLLYDHGVPLEFIQRTLRHATMEATLIYARKAIERMYFRKMKRL